MATRRVTVETGTVSFDHGAQYLPASDSAFAHTMRAAAGRGWLSDDTLVGVPGMSSLPRALADGLNISQQVEITRLVHQDDCWHLTGPKGQYSARSVVLAIPAPQARALLGDADPLAADLSRVIMSPCLALMAALPTDSPRPFPHRVDPAHPLAWIAQDSSKPGRSAAAVAWVAQAGPAFSAMHLEQTPEAIAALMLPLLCDVIGADPDQMLHVQAHRWRYAQTAKPLGQPFLQDHGRSLYVGGDWCLGPRAEHAWHSGREIAREIRESAHVV